MPANPRTKPALATAASQRQIARVVVRAATICPHTAYVRRMVMAAIHRLGDKCAIRDLSIHIVGLARIRAEHLRHFDDSTATDCMTFPIEVDGHGRAIEGDIMICWPCARRLAVSHGVAPRDELLLYAIHGLLHLCGMEDKTQRGHARMHELEDELLTALGVGAVYSAGVLAAVGKGCRTPGGSTVIKKGRP